MAWHLLRHGHALEVCDGREREADLHAEIVRDAAENRYISAQRVHLNKLSIMSVSSTSTKIRLTSVLSCCCMTAWLSHIPPRFKRAGHRAGNMVRSRAPHALH